MAHIRSGSIVSDIRGKVGTEIYSRNRGGAYVKSFTSPVQPNTSAQLTRRDLLSDAVTAWQGLEEDLRQRWLSYMNTRQPSDGTFEKLRRSAYNEFIRRKINLLVIGSPDDPLPYDNTLVNSLILNFVDPLDLGLRVNQTVIGDLGDYEVFWYASDVVPPSITSPNSVTMRFIGMLSPGSSGFTGLTTEWQSVYGTWPGTLGDRVFIGMKVVADDLRDSNDQFLGRSGQVVTPYTVKSGIITEF